MIVITKKSATSALALGYRVAQDYGVKGDGVTDDTAAINAMIASAGNTPCYFPAGKYIIGGPVDATSLGQIVLPSTTYSNNTSVRQCRLIGQGGVDWPETSIPSATIPLAQSGTIFQSTITSAPAGAAVINGIGDASIYGPYANVDFSMEGINVRVDAGLTTGGPCVSGVDARWMATSKFVECKASISVQTKLGVLPTRDVVGFRGTLSNGGTRLYFNNVVAAGYRYGVLAGEHTVMTNVQAHMCYIGVGFLGGNHGIYADKILAQWCAYGIGYVDLTNPVFGHSTAANIKIGLLNTEQVNQNSWYDYVATVYDPNNLLKGSLTELALHSTGGTPTGQFTKVGGGNLFCNNLLTAVTAVAPDASVPLPPAVATGKTRLTIRDVAFSKGSLWGSEGTPPKDHAYTLSYANQIIISFAGTEFSLYGNQAPGAGVVRMTLDATPPVTYDSNAAATAYYSLFHQFSGLSAGNHQLKIEKDADDNKGIVVDYGEYTPTSAGASSTVNATNAAFVTTPNSTGGDWGRENAPNGDAYTLDYGSFGTFAFTGTRLTLTGYLGTNVGDYRFTLDGGTPTVLTGNNGGASAPNQALYDSGVLTSGNHSLRIEKNVNNRQSIAIQNFTYTS